MMRIVAIATGVVVVLSCPLTPPRLVMDIMLIVVVSSVAAGGAAEQASCFVVLSCFVVFRFDAGVVVSGSSRGTVEPLVEQVDQ
jgi:hypothetical protein